jgi:hypothetical protein
MTAPTGTSAFVSSIAPTKLVPNEPALVDQQFTLADVDPIGRMEALIYGPPKSGKTVITGTFPPPFRWLAADGQSSLKSLRWAYKAGLTSLTDMKDLVAFVPHEQVKGRYISTAQAFNQMQDMTSFWFSEPERDKWQTLVIDSFTEVNDWALDLGLGLNKIYPKPDKPLSTSDEINRRAMTRLVTGQQDYKSAMGLIEGYLRNIREESARWNKNLVILCHEWQDTSEDKDGNQIVTAIRPLLIGQLREKISKSFDDVWHMEKYNKGTGIEIKVRMHGDNKTLAGSRWGSIMPREVEPDYRKMIAEVKKFHG